jgi:hypothetical protein
MPYDASNKTARLVYWAGSHPTHCQLTGLPMGDTMYDAFLSTIGWGNWNEETFVKYKGHLGTGRGQKYKLTDDNRWLKIEG